MRLGIWQLHRLDERRAFNDAVREGLAAPVRPLGSLIPERGADLEGLSYRRAQATGAYDVSHEVILYGRSEGGSPGNHVLTPMRLADGRLLIVDRGWVPAQDVAPPIVEASPPASEVTVMGMLLPPEESGGEPGQSPSTVSRIDLGQLGADLDGPVVPMYLQLRSQEPPQSGRLPEPASLPQLTEGPHLSYAVQWFLFALVALVGYGVLVRKELRQKRNGASASEDIRLGEP